MAKNNSASHTAAEAAYYNNKQQYDLQQYDLQQYNLQQYNLQQYNLQACRGK